MEAIKADMQKCAKAAGLRSFEQVQLQYINHYIIVMSLLRLKWYS